MDENETCGVAGCGRPRTARGLCNRHYQQMRRHGRLTPEREYGERHRSCQVPSCGEGAVAKGLCARHYQQVRRHGHLTPERERHVLGNGEPVRRPGEVEGRP